MGTDIAFHFEGKTLSAPEGASVAAALTAVGIRDFRHSESGASRGIFCGMGVCQDCLVEIDGIPNQRACMTALENGMQVRRQSARPSISRHAEASEPRYEAELLTPGVLVVGGGAAGLNAAIAAREEGAETLVLDERKVAGGQFYKQPAEARPLLDRQQRDGASLVARAKASGADFISGAEVWGAFDGPLITATAPGRALAIRPRAVIVATGAYERPMQVPGWTLPGVMTTGAAQTLWRSYRVLPGKRVAIFGNGPLNAQVALELAQGGAEIVALGEAANSPFGQPGASLKMLSRDPALTAKGIGLTARLAMKGIPVLHGATLVSVERSNKALIARYLHKGKKYEIEADAVCLNHGFQPQNEILRLLGAEMDYDAGTGVLRPVRTENMETSVAGVYAAGDCCGLGGAPAGVVEGRIAGRAAAGVETPNPADQKELQRHRDFQTALWSLYAAPMPGFSQQKGDANVCRCEEIRHSALAAALDGNDGDIGVLKRATRLGMGRCQGRYCGPVMAREMAERAHDTPTEFSHFAPRVPIKPVPIEAIAAIAPLFEDDG